MMPMACNQLILPPGNSAHGHEQVEVPLEALIIELGYPNPL